jgi:hypothetical protein
MTFGRTSDHIFGVMFDSNTFAVLITFGMLRRAAFHK